jgi:hypothetical protein
MKSSLLTFGRWVLLVWGGFSLAAVLVLGAMAFNNCTSSPRVDVATPRDVRFVLNMCGIGEERTERVIHSYESPTAMGGDHLDAYAILISKVDIAELTAMPDPRRASYRGWYRGDELPKVLEDAVMFIDLWRHEVPWFPTLLELRSADLYVCPGSVYYVGLQPMGADLVFVRPSDKMVFYLGCKM